MVSHKRQFAVGLTRVYTDEADSARPLLKCNLWGHLYYTDSQVQGSEGPTKINMKRKTYCFSVLQEWKTMIRLVLLRGRVIWTGPFMNI